MEALAEDEKKLRAAKKAQELVQEETLASSLGQAVERGLKSAYAFLIDMREKRSAASKLDNSLSIHSNEIEKYYMSANSSVLFGKAARDAITELKSYYSLGIMDLEKVSNRDIPVEDKLAVYKEIISTVEESMQLSVAKFKLQVSKVHGS